MARCGFRFSSATMAVDEETGELDTRKFNELITPLFAKLMQLDGMRDVKFVDRYAMIVDYEEHITGPERIDAHVQELMPWAATLEGLFPLVGDDVPRAMLIKPEEPERYLKDRLWVKAVFTTNVVRYPVAEGDNSFGHETFRGTTSKLVSQATNMDGAVDCSVTLTEVAVLINTDATTAQAAEEQMMTVFQDLANEPDNGIFPFHPVGTELNVTFSTQQVLC